MQKAKLFPNGQSQAVRLPKACRFDGDEVIVKRVGDAVLLLPLTYDKDVLLRELAQLPEDVLPEREQPETSTERDAIAP